MKTISLKLLRYGKCYYDLTFGSRPQSLEEVIDYCVDRPVLIGQVRSEILPLARLLKTSGPKRSLEIGTNYGGTLFLLCALSPPDATIISLDLPRGAFGGGYPVRKIPLFRRFARGNQRLHLIRSDSHCEKTKNRIMQVLNGERLDYLFVDADHTYSGVQQDFSMYSPLVRSGGIVAFHDIVTHGEHTKCEVASFWSDIKNRYRHLEFVEQPQPGSQPLAVTGARMETSGIGVIFIP
jgi:predicted O-methyltransferase YrrM